MSALSDIFTSAKAEGRAALVGYFPAGYPTVEGSVELATTLARRADLIEVGIPFTDPMMDGPTIQDAATTALEAGFRVRDTFTVIKAVTEAGGNAVIMSYWNPILQYGPEKFAADLAAAGGLGSIIPDLLPEEAERWTAACEANGLDNVYLVAPSTTPERMELTVNAGGGFIYAQSHMGVTGAQDDVSGDARDLVERTRATTDLPVAVGLGVKTGDHAAAIASYADGVIVGSALITAAAQGVEALDTLAAELEAGVRR
ncbi:MAG: tryptophan synthase subunit alpha [Corynebacterium sp.]|uniref:Tryptophan synthase alpha chain n=1 Tax=Candidatus Corynebacterium faecigallinarum TaxID=2838528 RepID=A0A9D2TR00_9CORY|nr:tryptophan synthase subunit alpha [Corynebacterium sp.]HJC86323.1 tryptophan synthase subunit alpha [Candidatus Corynebacterium faecigallinarum]MDN5721543.1 tryptophan synthase subunit alpha [Corynebacterium sp.]MDN6282102.1 tryptophan synthase subunit alpha [Corynebacterium sp.]MDN6306746.1 tryptophan synthase subunit alpha [Corynebacterium sp.]MDN6367896.1 tryptophan synthase subunit alpha [Corynebacterium sp.]